MTRRQSAAEISRRSFLKGSAAIGLLAVMPTAAKRALAINDELSLAAPIPMPDVPGSGRVLGWAVTFDEPRYDGPEEAVALSLWRGSTLLQREIGIVRVGSFQMYFHPDLAPIGDLDEFRLEMNVPGYAVMYTTRGVGVLRIAG